MITVDITLDDDLLFKLREQVKAFEQGGTSAARVFPETARSFTMAAQVIQKSWQNWALGGHIEDATKIKNPSPKLASSIKIIRANDFDITVGTDSRYMQLIQNGKDEHDMKTTHPFGRKSRVSKKGVQYLVVPFRWGTYNKGVARAHFGKNNTMSEAVSKMVTSRKFQRSNTKNRWGTHYEPNARGEFIVRPNYEWGDRLGKDFGNESGMVRMLDDSGKKPKSTYFTFRVISAETKTGWVIPEVEANDVVGALKRSLERQTNDIIGEGFKSDLGLI